MSDKHYTEVQREKRGTKTELHNLLSARDKFKVGQWIKFETVGRIVKATTNASDMNLSVEVEVVSDVYNSDVQRPITEPFYQCDLCGEEFSAWWKFREHYDTQHKPKPAKKKVAKRKTAKR